MRKILASILMLASGLASAAWVDLDKPGALERLGEDNPWRYELAVAILRAAERNNCAQVLKLYKVAVERGSFSCQDAMIMTSYPAKKRVIFVIDKDTYSATVVLSTRRESGSPR